MFLSFQSQGVILSFYEDPGKVAKIRRELKLRDRQIIQNDDLEGQTQKILILT
jgi:hypothetical protein